MPTTSDSAFSENVLHLIFLLIVNEDGWGRRSNPMGKGRRIGNKGFELRNMKDRMDFNVRRKGEAISNRRNNGNDRKRPKPTRREFADIRIKGKGVMSIRKPYLIIDGKGKLTTM